MDQFDGGIAQHLAPIGVNTRDAVLGGSGFEGGSIPPGKGDDLGDAGFVVSAGAERAEAARADEADGDETIRNRGGIHTVNLPGGVGT